MFHPTPDPGTGMIEDRLAGCQWLSPPTLEVDAGLVSALPQIGNRLPRAVRTVGKNLRITPRRGIQQLPEDTAVMYIRRCHVPIGYQLGLAVNRYMVLVAVVIHTVLPHETVKVFKATCSRQDSIPFQLPVLPD